MDRCILVTGGAGFIGSYLCEKLLNSGKEVVCVDSLITGRKKNLGKLLDNQKLRFIEGDIRNASLYGSLKLLEINQIYDLASPAIVDFVVSHPILTATTNSLGTYQLLEFARLKGAKILFASSSEVYGDPHDHPQKESYWGNVNPVGARSGYDEGKRFAEALVTAFGREHNLDVGIARIFNTYGPRSSPADGRVIPRFVTAALGNKSLPVHGDGTQTRSLCYVSDLVDGLIKLMNSTVKTPVNLGNPIETKIIDVANLIIKLTKSSSNISYLPRPEDDPARRMPDIGLAKKELSWEPKITLEEGLILTIEYFLHEL